VDARTILWFEGFSDMRESSSKTEREVMSNTPSPFRAHDSSTSPEPAALHSSALPALSADLLLLHAPAFFDFRNRRDIYFPFLGTSGDVPITPLYEYSPSASKCCIGT
jgi:hypothetical protein